MKFEIETIPIGKGRPRFTRYGSTYTPQKTRDYENLVKISYLKCKDNKLYTLPIKIEIWAYFEPIKSISKKKRVELLEKQIYYKKPDADNIAKAILDGLNKVAYNDDNQICDLIVHKRYAEKSKVIIEITEVSE